MKRSLIFIIFIMPLLVIGCGGGGGPGEVVTFGGLVLLQDGTPLEGVDVTFFWPDPPNVNSDGTWTVLTDKKGWYSDWHRTIWGDRAFTITPSHPGYEFSPTSYFFEGSYEDNLDLDFIAIPIM